MVFGLFNKTQKATVPSNPTSSPKSSIFEKAKHFASDRIQGNPSSNTGKLITDTYNQINSYFTRDSSILDNYKNPNQLTNIICKQNSIEYIHCNKGSKPFKNDSDCAGRDTNIPKFLIDALIKLFTALNNSQDLSKLYGSERNALFTIIERYKKFQMTYDAYIAAFNAWINSNEFKKTIPIPLTQTLNSMNLRNEFVGFKPLPQYNNVVPANQNNITQSDVQNLLENKSVFLKGLTTFNTTVSNEPIVPTQLSARTFSEIMNNDKTDCDIMGFSGNSSGNSGSGSSGTMSIGFNGGKRKRKRTRRNHKKKRQNKSKMRKRR